MRFDIERKGYKKEQVDAYIKQLGLQYDNAAAEQKDRIFELKSSLTAAERLIEEYRRKESEINSALVAAVNKAKEMEDIAQKKYDLEIQRLKLFNAKWQSYFSEIIKRYPIDDNLVSVAEFTSEMAEILSGRDRRAKAETADAPANKEPEKTHKTKKTAEVKTPAPLTRMSDAKAQFESEKKRLAEVQPDPISSIGKYFENLKKDAADKNKNAAAPESKDIGEAPEDKDIASAPGSKDIAAAVSESKDIAATEQAGGFNINEALHPDQELEEILRELGITGK